MELPPEVRELFEKANFAHLATLTQGRLAQLDRDLGRARGRQRRLLHPGGLAEGAQHGADPRVAISITDHEDPYQTAQLRGRVIEVRGADEANDLADALALRYTGEPFPYKPPTSRLYVVEIDKVRSTQLPFEHRPSAA